jgi:D-alanyl-D-alanine dipeptidase
VPPHAQRNRLLLNAIMFGGGFVGISSEWWHFDCRTPPVTRCLTIVLTVFR